MGVESYLVLWVFTDECCHPNRFRVELMLIESFEIGRLDFPNRDTLKSTHCFLTNNAAHCRRAAGLGVQTDARSRRPLQPPSSLFAVAGSGGEVNGTQSGTGDEECRREHDTAGSRRQ